jgi:hypothetical protein
VTRSTSDASATSIGKATTSAGRTGEALGPPAIEKIVENDRQASQSCECSPDFAEPA